MRPDKKSVRFGLVGPGSHAQKNLIPAMAKSTAAELRVIIGGADGGSLAATLGVSWERDLDAALGNSDLNAVLVSTPNSSHYMVVKRALEADLHVLCEKPMCLTSEQTAELVELAAGRGLVLREGMMFLHHPQFEKLQVALSRIDFKNLRATFGFPMRQLHDWRYSADGGGALLDAGIYPVAATCALLRNPEIVYASIDRSPELGVDVSGIAVARDENQRIGIMEWAFGMEYVNRISAWGNAGLVSCSPAFSKPPGLASVVRVRTNDSDSNINVQPADQFSLQFEWFANRVRARQASADTQSLQRARLLDDIRAMANQTKSRHV